MHRRLFGLSCTLAVLIAGYVIGWLADRVMHGFTDSYSFSFFLLALLLAAMFTLAVLFLQRTRPSPLVAIHASRGPGR